MGYKKNTDSKKKIYLKKNLLKKNTDSTGEDTMF